MSRGHPGSGCSRRSGSTPGSTSRTSRRCATGTSPTTWRSRRRPAGAQRARACRAARRIGARHREPASGAVLGRDERATCGAAAGWLRRSVSTGASTATSARGATGSNAPSPSRRAGDPALGRALVGLARIAWVLGDPRAVGQLDRAAFEAAQASGRRADRRPGAPRRRHRAHRERRLDEATAVARARPRDRTPRARTPSWYPTPCC